jgi:hypothetical protein
VPTPNLDSIARSGVRFTNGYVSAPVCSPSRAGLITGRYQTRFGHEFNHPMADRAPVGLPVSETTAADRFKAAGYLTGHIGKWHLGNPNLPVYSPASRGFVESAWFPGQKKLPPLTVFRNGERRRTDDRYVDEAIAREGAAFIEAHRDTPWFLYVGFLTPHQPLDTPPGTEEPFARIEDAERRIGDAPRVGVACGQRVARRGRERAGGETPRVVELVDPVGPAVEISTQIRHEPKAEVQGILPRVVGAGLRRTQGLLLGDKVRGSADIRRSDGHPAFEEPKRIDIANDDHTVGFRKVQGDPEGRDSSLIRPWQEHRVALVALQSGSGWG